MWNETKQQLNDLQRQKAESGLTAEVWAVPATEKRLLHPRRDRFDLHLRQESDGLLTALTETGKFHLARLRLNRPPLVALRRARMKNACLREELQQAQAAQKSLTEQLRKIDGEIERIYEKIIRLLNR